MDGCAGRWILRNSPPRTNHAALKIGRGEAFKRISTPEIEAFVVPGGNFPTLLSVAAWEAEFGVPVVTTNTAAFWGMLHAFDAVAGLDGFGRLLAELP